MRRNRAVKLEGENPRKPRSSCGTFRGLGQRDQGIGQELGIESDSNRSASGLIEPRIGHKLDLVEPQIGLLAQSERSKTTAVSDSLGSSAAMLLLHPRAFRCTSTA